MNDYPVLGILTWPSRISRLQEGETAPSMELAAMAAKQVGVDLYFFRTRDVHLKSKRIDGWQQQRDGAWAQVPKPWPDVFHPAMQIRSSKGKRIKEALLKHAKPINAHDVLSKWEVHQSLNRFLEMQSYLPETVIYTQQRDLEEMLLRHKSILAKPCYGLGAMRISKVWTMDTGLYGWEDSSTGAKLNGLSFQRMLAKVIENADGPFVVQEELLILEADSKRNKVRVILNKDGEGRWRRSLSYAYVGKAGQFAVSRHQGAEQMPLYRGLATMGVRGCAAKLISHRIAKVALLVVKCLDQAKGPLGEIGLDLAVGERGRVWLIEANARPNKDNLPFTRKATLLRPFLLMMQYAKYLAQQPAGRCDN